MCWSDAYFDERRIAFAKALIDDRLETIRRYKEYAKEREKLVLDAETRSFSLPPADATDKLLRYEAHLYTQLYRAMDELESLQRRRRGEKTCRLLSILMWEEGDDRFYQTKPRGALFSINL